MMTRVGPAGFDTCQFPKQVAGQYYFLLLSRGFKVSVDILCQRSVINFFLSAPRKVFDLGHRCLFGSSVFDDGQNVLVERCTKCVCLVSSDRRREPV